MQPDQPRDLVFSVFVNIVIIMTDYLCYLTQYQLSPKYFSPHENEIWYTMLHLTTFYLGVLNKMATCIQGKTRSLKQVAITPLFVHISPSFLEHVTCSTYFLQMDGGPDIDIDLLEWEVLNQRVGRYRLWALCLWASCLQSQEGGTFGRKEGGKWGRLLKVLQWQTQTLTLALPSTVHVKRKNMAASSVGLSI